jgi:hypothetical protein
VAWWMRSANRLTTSNQLNIETRKKRGSRVLENHP